MTEPELIRKLEEGREDWRDGYMTDRDYLEWLASVLDGTVSWALQWPAPPFRKRVVMTVRARSGDLT